MTLDLILALICAAVLLTIGAVLYGGRRADRALAEAEQKYAVLRHMDRFLTNEELARERERHCQLCGGPDVDGTGECSDCYGAGDLAYARGQDR